MDESTGKLDQVFVKRAIDAFLLWQPDLLEHIVRFIEELPVETIKIRQIVRLEMLSLKALDDLCDFGRFAAHGRNLLNFYDGLKMKRGFRAMPGSLFLP